MDYYLDEENINRFLGLFKPEIQNMVYLKEYKDKSIKRIIRVSHKIYLIMSIYVILNQK